MTGAEIITGGAGAGKTGEIVARLAELYRSDPFAEALVLAPTVRHADQLRRRLVAECGVALRLRVETLPTLSRTLVKDHPILSGGQATDLLARVARRLAARRGPAAYFAPIAGTAGFVTSISTAITGLLDEEIDDAGLRAAAARTGSERARALASIYSAYLAELRQQGLIHPLQIHQRAAAAVQGSKIPAVVMVDGFQRFTRGEIRLLASLAGRADITVTFDPDATERSRFDYARLRDALPHASETALTAAAPPETPAVIKGEASSVEQHAREIARGIKRLMSEHPELKPSDCAVTFRRVTPYLSLMRRIFEEYEIPLDPAAGARLSDTPLGVWLRRLLGIAQNGWRVKDVRAVLRAGFLDLSRWSLTLNDVEQLGRRARESQVWAGREDLERVAAELPRRGDNRLLAALRDIDRLLEPPEEEQSARHAQRITEALFGQRPWLRQTGIDEETTFCAEKLREYLTELAAPPSGPEADQQEESLTDFLERLNRRLDMPVLMRRTPGGVLLAPMHTLHGLRFRFVAIGGLSEGEFPAGRRSGELLDEQMRSALADAGLALPPPPRSTESELWESVTSRADDTTALWRYRIDARGRPAPAAWVYTRAETEREPFGEWDGLWTEAAASHREVAIACARGWLSESALRPPPAASPDGDSWETVRVAAVVEQTRRSFRFMGPYEGDLTAGLMPPELTDGQVEWSATSLESYLTCGFQYFGGYALKLSELTEEAEDADAAIRGIVIHKILEEAVRPLVEKGLALTPETLPDVLSRVDTEGKQIWDAAPQEHGFGRAALWHVRWPRQRDLIRALISNQARLDSPHEGARVLSTEGKLRGTLPTKPPMRVVARIDRIDEEPEYLRVIDYKTGWAPSQKAVHDGRSLQLPLYAYILRQDPRAKDKDIRAAYARLPAPGAAKTSWWIDTRNDDAVEAMERVVKLAGDVRDGVAQGDFRVYPQVPTCPPNCEFRRVCRVNPFSRSKTP